MGHELSAANRERRRDRILEIATEVLFEHGYAATTMSTVSTRLGGSKATLYAYFRSKQELCEAIIERQCDSLVLALAEATTQPDLEGQLKQLGLSFMQVLASDQGVKTIQLAIEGSRSNRELAQHIETVGFRAITNKLANLLEAAETRGEISAPDPVEAANVFVSLLRGNLHFRRLLNLVPEPSLDEMKAEVGRVTAVFMRAFSTR